MTLSPFHCFAFQNGSEMLFDKTLKNFKSSFFIDFIYKLYTILSKVTTVEMSLTKIMQENIYYTTMSIICK